MGYTWCCETSGRRADCASMFCPSLCEHLPHRASQGAVPTPRSWSSSELGCFEGSFRDEASFLACLRPLHFRTRHPGTAKRLLCAVLLAFLVCTYASALSRAGPASLLEQHASESPPLSTDTLVCHRLRRNHSVQVPRHR